MSSIRTVALWGALCLPITIINSSPRAYFGPSAALRTRLFSLLAHARRHILVASYVLTSKQLIVALLAAHKRGVRVEIITDEHCCQTHRGRQVLIALKRAGIPHFIHRHGTPRSLMHHKCAVIDNVAWIGSMNWTTRGLHLNHENIIVYDSPAVVARLTAHFYTLKHRTLGTQLRTSGSSQHELLFVPDQRTLIRKLLLKDIASAQSTIMLALYDLTSRVLLRSLLAAAQRGVTVRIAYDMERAMHEPGSVINELEKTPGVICYQHKGPGTFHHKFALIDDHLWTGSMNWTGAGMGHNQETVIHTTYKPLIAAYKNAFRRL